MAAATKALEYSATAYRTWTSSNPGRSARTCDSLKDGSSLWPKSKGTKRGPGENFIGQAIEHAGRYAREFHVVPPACVLVVDHNRLLPPDKRPAFYAASHVQDRLVQNVITAVDSVALHHACQAVMAGKARPDDIRARIQTPGVATF